MKRYLLALSVSALAALALSFICKSEAIVKTDAQPATVTVDMQYEISSFVLEQALSIYTEKCMLEDVNNIRINMGLGKTNYQALGCSSEGVKDSSLEYRLIPMEEINL